MFIFKKKVLFGLSVSMVLAMAIGSFALSETQANDTTEVTAGAFTITGEDPTLDQDYTFTGTTGTDGVLTIISDKEMTIKNTNSSSTTDQIVIDLPDGVDEANIILDGVNISTDQGAALEIKDDAAFNVNITLADKSENTLTGRAGSSSFGDGQPGIQKNGDTGVGMLTISGTGELKATGGYIAAGIGGGADNTGMGISTSNITIAGGNITATGGYGAAGIGGGNHGSGSSITISGGKVEAYAGKNNDTTYSSSYFGAGIGGGASGSGSDITISGGVVTATGFNGGAGIGGGCVGDGTRITISGGNITATGGYIEEGSTKASGAGIGGGATKTGSNNKLNGNAVVLAISGEDNTVTGGVKPQLDGFADSDKTGGIVFTGLGTYKKEKDTDKFWVLKSIAWEEGTQYGNVTITEDTTSPADFTITSTAALTVGKNAEGKEATLSMAEGKKLTVEGSLINEGVINIPAENLICNGNGKITTLLNYDPQGGEIVTNDDEYITYQDASGVNQYETLPDATKEGYDLDAWYTKEKGQGTKVEEGDNVLLNEHTLYANWIAEPEPTPTPPTPTPPGPEPTPTPPEPGPEPTPTPEPTPDPSVNPDGGSGASSKTSDPFMGGAALALLGVATTGAVLVRKRK